MTEDLSPEQWATLEEMFHETVDLPSEDLSVWLDTHCTDPDMRERLLELLNTEQHLTEQAQVSLNLIGDWLDETTPVDRVGSYLIEKEIGLGGSSRVFLATREHLGGRVALKLLRRDPLIGDEAARRFEMEHQVLARMEHTHIARLFDAGVEDDLAYLAMEYVEGITITEFCADKPLNVRLNLFLQVCQAVGYAHRRGIIHRDIKPANILVTEDGTVKLLDFGIAKLLEPEADSPYTRPNTRLMTPQYAAPEQLLGGEVTTLSDVYALGLLLYELLTGGRPFNVAGNDQRALEDAMLKEIPPSPSSRLHGTERRRIRGDLDAIVLHALHLDQQKRYASVAAMADDVTHFLENRPVQAVGISWRYRGVRFIQRNMLPVAVATIIVITGLIYVWREAVLRAEAEAALATSEQVTEFLVSLFTSSDPGTSRGRTITVREVVDEGVARVQTQLAEQPEVRVRLEQSLGTVYRALGLYEEAAALLEPALTTAIDLYGDDALEVANLQSDLAYLYNLNSLEYERSDEVSLDSLQTLEKHYGVDSLEVARHKNNIAFGWVRSSRNHEQARLMLEDVLHTLGEQIEDDHAEIASTLFHLGWAYGGLGDMEKSEYYYRESLAMRRRLYQGDHPSLGWVLNNLGNLYATMGRLDEAEAACAEALAMNRRLFEGLHNEQGFNLRCLARVEDERGNHEQALRLSTEAVEIVSATMPENALELASALGVHADVLSSLGQNPRAVEVQTRVRDILSQYDASYHRPLVSALNNLAYYQSLMGDVDNARVNYAQAVELGRVIHGESGISLAIPLYNLAVTQLRAYYPEDAERSIVEALELLGDVDEPDLRHAMFTLVHGQVLMEKRIFATACQHSASALRDIRELVGEAHFRYGTALNVHGQCLAGRDGLTEQAEEMMQRGVAILEATLPATDARIEEARERLRSVRRPPDVRL